jgi:alpha-N-arabinofuranosidase
MDGPWQLGHQTPAEYGRLAAETARGMRQFDPTLELVACGSSARSMPTFGTWEETVLTEAYDLVDHISAHAYYELEGDDLPGFLASAVDLGEFLDDVVARADQVAARVGSAKRLAVSLDEWNVWYLKGHMARMATDPPVGWPTAPRLSEDDYTVADAVVVGSMLITMLRHADRVTAACLAQLVNSLGAIRTEPGGPAWRQSIFHPFAQTAAAARGSVLNAEVRAPLVAAGSRGEAPAVDAVATWGRDDGGAGGRLAVFAVNRSVDSTLPLEIDLGAFPGLRLHSATVLQDDDWRAVNTMAAPDRVAPRAHPAAIVDGGRLRVELPPVSWNVVQLCGETF